MRRTLVPVSVVLLFVLCTLGTSLLARQARQDPDVLAALLIEVRGLRAAMEAMAATGPHVQLTMGRLQLQEQRINTLVRRLDEVRDRRIGAERELEERTRELDSLKERLSSFQVGPADGRPTREEIESALKDHRARLPDFKAHVQRLQAEEAALSQDVASEQGRWSEINQRLEELDRALTRR